MGTSCLPGWVMGCVLHRLGWVDYAECSLAACSWCHQSCFAPRPGCTSPEALWRSWNLDPERGTEEKVGEAGGSPLTSLRSDGKKEWGLEVAWVSGCLKTIRGSESFFPSTPKGWLQEGESLPNLL